MQQHFKMVWGPFVWRNREGTEGGRRIQVVLHVDEDDPVEIMMEQHGGEFWSGSLSQLTARELYCWKAAFGTHAQLTSVIGRKSRCFGQVKQEMW